MGSERFNVELQGVTPDLMQANGSYDAVAFKNLSAQRIAEILQIISQLCPPDGDDICPINLTVTGACGDRTFTVFDDSGQVYCAEPEGVVTIEQAILMITGQKPDFVIAGSVQTQAPAASGNCPNCQAKVEPDESFCGSCGQAVVRHAPPPPPSAPSSQKRSARKAGKKAPVDQQTYDLIVGLMAKTVSLREYRSQFPVLQKGPKGDEFRALIDSMFRADPPPQVHTRLTMPPRDWAIRKPGFFRRMLTGIVDFPMILVLIVAGAKFGKTLNLDADSALTGILALSWIFVIAPVGYYALFESILGASPGGLLMGLRVVDEYGNTASPKISIMRILGKILWLVMLVLSIFAARQRMDMLPGHMVKLPSGAELQPIDDGEVVIN